MDTIDTVDSTAMWKQQKSTKNEFAECILVQGDKTNSVQFHCHTVYALSMRYRFTRCSASANQKPVSLNI